MDSLLAYAAAAVVLVVSLSLLFIISSGKSNQKNLPPGSQGWPILGENLEFAVLGTEKFVQNRMAKHSAATVFQTSILGERVAVFCGAQGNKFVMGKLDTIWWPKSMKRVTLFPEFVDGDILALLRSLHGDIFAMDALRRYVLVMDGVAARLMDTVCSSDNSVVKLFPLIKKYTFEVACTSFLSITDPHHISDLFEPFSLMVAGMFSLPIDFPGTSYNRAMRGGRVARGELMRIIKDRRRKERKGGDVLSKMLLATDENGGFFDEREIANNIIALMVGGFESTSSATAALMNNIAQLPHVYREVLKEQMEIARSKGPDEALTWEDIEKMKYSWNVVRETLRLNSPAQGVFKEVTSDINYAGFTIPRGWKAFWTVFSSHLNPDYFPEPEKFDPSRFEGKGPAPYTFVPFGGGRRICPGREIARSEILVFLHNVVTRFKLEKTIPNEKIVHNPSPAPVHGLPVRFHPHQVVQIIE